MLTDDKILNQYVSLKKLAPYRTDNGIVPYSKLKKKMILVENSTMQNKVLTILMIIILNLT